MGSIVSYQCNLKPGLSERGFRIGLYLEHLEESSALYEQRQSHHTNPEITWQDMRAFEERFEAHIDALVVGEELALAVCRQQAIEGDFGELHAAVRVFCRQDRYDLFEQILEEIDPEDEEKMQAIRDALAHELPQSWQNHMVAALHDTTKPILYAIAPYVAGFRRIDAKDELIITLQQETNPQRLTDIIHALGRVGAKTVPGEIIKPFLQHEDQSVQYETALCQLRAGNKHLGIFFTEQIRQGHTWPWMLLAISGAPGTVASLIDSIPGEKHTAESLLCAGFMGDPVWFPLLVECLSNPDLAEAASYALVLITNAPLMEDAFIPEEPDEEMLFDDEKKAIKNGEPWKEAGEREPGETVTRISQNPDEWSQWLEENKETFQPGKRYRLGESYSKQVVINSLQSEKVPFHVRSLIYEEVVIRFDTDMVWENDMFVGDQEQTMMQLV